MNQNPMPPLVLESLNQLHTHVGREIGTTGWMQLTQERIRQFADVSGDTQWIHVDAERARRESPYGGTIAHGFLTLSLATHFLREAIQPPPEVRQIINYGLNRVRFPAPVRAGENIRARIALQAYKDLTGSVEAIFNITMEAQDSAKPCCVAEWLVRYFY
ncbi:MAG TPA: MaoC family dehydratase [Candidatus Acidoferrales bacterium]|nr:MaoC family dehydratase [Candidatus Acidoferrales bacterium]